MHTIGRLHVESTTIESKSESWKNGIRVGLKSKSRVEYYKSNITGSGIRLSFARVSISSLTDPQYYNPLLELFDSCGGTARPQRRGLVMNCSSLQLPSASERL